MTIVGSQAQAKAALSAADRMGGCGAGAGSPAVILETVWSPEFIGWHLVDPLETWRVFSFELGGRKRVA